MGTDQNSAFEFPGVESLPAELRVGMQHLWDHCGLEWLTARAYWPLWTGYKPAWFKAEAPVIDRLPWSRGWIGWWIYQDLQRAYRITKLTPLDYPYMQCLHTVASLAATCSPVPGIVDDPNVFSGSNVWFDNEDIAQLTTKFQESLSNGALGGLLEARVSRNGGLETAGLKFLQDLGLLVRGKGHTGLSPGIVQKLDDEAREIVTWLRAEREEFTRPDMDQSRRTELELLRGNLDSAGPRHSINPYETERRKAAARRKRTAPHPQQDEDTVVWAIVFRVPFLHASEVRRVLDSTKGGPYCAYELVSRRLGRGRHAVKYGTYRNLLTKGATKAIT